MAPLQEKDSQEGHIFRTIKFALLLPFLELGHWEQVTTKN